MKNNPLSAASDNSQRETFTLMLSLHGRKLSNLSLVTPVLLPFSLLLVFRQCIEFDLIVSPFGFFFFIKDNFVFCSFISKYMAT